MKDLGDLMKQAQAMQAKLAGGAGAAGRDRGRRHLGRRHGRA